MLGTFKSKFMICRNKLENVTWQWYSKVFLAGAPKDINWDNPDMKWVKTSSMARMHRFLTTRDLNYQRLGALYPLGRSPRAGGQVVQPSDLWPRPQR